MVRAADSDNFLIQHTDFSLREQVNYPNGGISRFYDNGIDMVIIDENICDHNPGEPVFSYMLITDKQNSYIHQFKRVFRFLGYIQSEVDSYLANDEMTLPEDYRITVGDRAEQADASPLEIHFEDSFSNAYGMNALRYLTREYGICDENGNNYFLDYFIRTQTERYAVEENGLSFHHPQIIGEEKYKKQLKKQNTCVLWGIKLFRFSREDCAFENRIEDDIKQYFGKDTAAFVDDGLKIDRKVELYEHQTVSLQEIRKRRMAGIKAFLIVLPTASGKSRIVEEDLREFAKEKPGFRGLILVPGINILADWRERVQESVPELVEKIEIRTYAYMCRHYTEYPADYYNYIVVDEAHHAVAPMLKRVIQYYEADFTVGLTATDQRPDKKKLETVFGTYSTSLSLKEAMEKGIVARANVYRIETNIDLSKVRFNGKDYINADLEKRIRVTSRNELIVNVLQEYLGDGEAARRQGVIFCVNVAHANEMAKLLNKANITAASYTKQTKNPAAVMADFKQKKIRFLCACNMISEGWDYPELGILVMATHKMMIAVVNNKLQNTFKDQNKQLFKNMLAVLKQMDDDSKPEFKYGTYRFEYVWEKMIDKVFGISEKIDYFPKTTWNLIGDSKYDNAFLEPDSIMLYGGKVFVLDAKYYKYGWSGAPGHLPESTSINKQITYGEYIAESDRFIQDGQHPVVYNAFLMPYDSMGKRFPTGRPIHYIGTATSDWKTGNQKYENVVGLLLDVKYLMGIDSRLDESEIMKLAAIIEEKCPV